MHTSVSLPQSLQPTVYIYIPVAFDVLKLVTLQISLDLPLATLERNSLQSDACPVLGLEDSDAATQWKISESHRH